MKDKIKELKELKKIIDKERKSGKIIVFTNGCFDILHIGHIRYLKESKKYGDILIVAINSDSSVKALKGAERPIFNENERSEMLSSLECVDFVIIFNELDPYNIISFLKPDILVKGGDWSYEAIIGRDVLESYGGKVIRIPEIKGFSTTDIIDKILKLYRS
jgi:D-beta-D-heptose 7-phosphate kinase/D-beta-D-heptose 1-phosphate adenosyltransferase